MISSIQIFYLSMALIGGILPLLANIEFVKINSSFNIIQFIKEANLNAASKSLSRDLLISSIVGFTWMILETKRLKMNNLWLLILSTFTLAWSFSFPLFLFFRERHLLKKI